MTSVNIWRQRFKGNLSFVWSLALVVFLIWPYAHLVAQVDQGIIGGVVQDKTGSVIPGAQVTLTDTDTGITLQGQTNGSGIYLFPSTKIGNYKLTASRAGFRTLTQENIHLDVQDRLNVVLVLQPGVVTQTIIVNSTPVLLQNQDASVGQVMTTRTINATPLNGRNWVYIAQMAAGVDPSHGSRGVGSGDFYANGQRAEQNNFILDGVDNNTYAPDYLNGASYNAQPPPDALAEFKIQTGDYSAEFGHSAGGVMNASIKSGTNDIHGSLWEYVRNDIFNARNFNALTIPKYRENQFGATLGLPVIKNKLFFFGYSEANRIVFAQTNTFSVPTALMRQGNFTELLNTNLTGSAQPTTLYQPGSAGTQPLVCNGQANVICTAQIDKVAETLINLYPTPNANGGKTYSNYVSNSNSTSNTWQWGARVDWNISSRDQAFARFSYVHIPSNYVPPLGPIADGGTYGSDGSIVNLGEDFAFSETHIFNPSFSNEARYGYSYGDYQFLQSNYDKDIAPTFGLGGIPTGPIFGGLPSINLTGLSYFGTTNYMPAGKHSNEYQIMDNVTKIIGNHSLRFGMDLQSVRIKVASYPYPRGSYTYTGTYSSVPGKSFTGFGATDFLLNQMNSAIVTDNHPFDDARWYRAFYFQDDWRVNQRLTLNLGLRYDYYQAFKEVSREQANFTVSGPVTPGKSQAVLTYPTQKTPLTLAPAFLNYLNESNVAIQYSNNQFLVNMPKTNFAPRIGFAYMANQHTVVRGGYGIIYGGLDPQLDDGPATNYPFRFNSSILAPGTCTPGNCLTNGITLENGFTAQLAEGLANAVSTPSFSAIDQDLPATYAESYNLTVERSITPNMTATVGYVGAVDRHLGIYLAQNGAAALTDPRLNSQLATPFPLLGSINVGHMGGAASYNSLQTKLQKRFDNGVSFLGTYTYAHSLDDAPEELGSTGDSAYRSTNLIGISHDYSNSAQDVRHRFTFMGLYELPFGAGRPYLNHPGLIDIIAGGWAADLTFAAQTGQPFTVGDDLGSAGPNGASANAIRIRDPFAPGGSPDPSNPGVTCAQHTRTLQHWYNPCAFANPPKAFPLASVAGSPISTQQITGLAALPYLGGVRNNMHGPGYERINLSLFKSFRTFREQHLEFRADIFNLLNTPAYGDPSTASNASAGGLITAPQNFQNFTPDARFFQFSGKYEF